MKKFNLKSHYSPAGDQPIAIKSLVEGIISGEQHQTLLGVTGSGKTYTMAEVIKETNKTTLVMAPNKTLAAQLYSEMRDFFPDNRSGNVWRHQNLPGTQNNRPHCTARNSRCHHTPRIS